MGMSLRYTSRDLEGMPDIDGVRYEIIDGDLYVSRVPDWHHQYVCSQIVWALQNWNHQTRAGMALFAPGVVFAEDDNVVPDIVWLSTARVARVMDASGHLTAAPELIVEVVSPGAVNERRDRDLKLKLYSRQGVNEYWIVDWQARTIQVYRRQQAALQLAATLDSRDELTTPLLPGFVCPVASLWEPPA